MASTPVILGPPAAAPAGAGRRTWVAGTLTYTTGGLGVLFFWLLWGDFTLFLRDRAVPPTMQILLSRHGASNALAGLLLGTCPSLIGMIVSPIVSYRSDRHRGRWGRRIPFLLLPTPFAVVSIIGLAFSPAMGQWMHDRLGFGAAADAPILYCLAIFWIVFEVASIVCASVLGGLCNDVVPREVLGRFFGLFRMASVAAAIVFNYWLLGKAEKHYLPMFVGLAVLYGASFSLMCWKVREGDYPPPPVHAERAGSFTIALRAYCRDCFTNSYYLWFFATVALANMSFSCVTLFTFFYAKAVGMNLDTFGKRYITVQFIISFVQAFPLGWLADKIHALRLIMISTALYGCATLAAFVLIHDARTFGIMTVTVGVFAGWWLTAFGPLAPALLPRAKFAQFSSAMGICSALGVLIVGPAVGKFLDWTGNNYRYTFLWATVFAVMSLAASVVVYRKFVRYGGVSGYAPPGDT